MSNLEKNLHLRKLVSKPPPLSSKVGPLKRKNRDYSPAQWQEFFDSSQVLEDTNGDKFRIFEKGTEGPVCLFLHGGGFSALSWAVLVKQLHSCVACRSLAIDFRGHGGTSTSDDRLLSSEQLVRDTETIVRLRYQDAPPPIMLVGHSMGGAIAARVAASARISSLVGLAVIDVVEGSALDALAGMQTFLRSRPSTFKTLDSAIEWCVRSGHIRNVESARVSMPTQLRSFSVEDSLDGSRHSVKPVSQDCIKEEDGKEEDNGKEEEDGKEDNGKEEEDRKFACPVVPPATQLTWRIDLTKTEVHWKGWFEGLSAVFLESSLPKMLLLAGVNRLDRELTIGQMQGKFQMQVLPMSGHAIHEDAPDQVADALATFLVRHKMTTAKESFNRVFPAC